MAQGPVVHQGVAGAGVEGQHVAVGADPGDIADPADIDEHHRAGIEGGRQGTVIDRGERCALAAGCNIGGAQIGNHRDAGLPGKRCAIAQLHRKPRRGTVQHRLAVKADDIDRARIQPQTGEQIIDRCGVARSDHRLGLGQRAGSCVAVGEACRCIQRCGQHFTFGGGIGKARCAEVLDDVLAVAADQCGVDAVQ